MTEADYLRFLYDEGRVQYLERCVPGVSSAERWCSESCRRRSGKTLITSCIVAYENYKLLLLGNPQKYYGSYPEQRDPVDLSCY